MEIIAVDFISIDLINYRAMNSNLILEPGAVVKRVREVQWSQLDDEMLAIDSQAGNCYSLNQTGAKVWDLIATPISVSDLCERLATSYNVAPETCWNDTVELLLSLREAGLVSIES